MDHGEGGLRRAIGPWGLGAAIFNTVVGAGIFKLPAALAREAGAAAPLAYLGCTVIVGCVAVCFAAAGSRTPVSGGPYGYAEAAFGPFMGFVTGVMVWLGSVLAAAGISAAIAEQVASVAPVFAQPVPRGTLIVALLAALAAVNLAGAGSGTRLVGVLTLLKLLPLAALLLGGAVVLGAHPGAAAAASPPGGAGSGGAGFGRAMLLAIFAFQGMETALGVSGEVRDPSRSIPRGLLGAMAAVAVLYIALQLVAERLLGPALPGSETPLAAAAAVVWRPLGAVLLVGAVASMLGYLASDALSAPRTLYAFGEAGVLPRAYGRAWGRTGAPALAIVTHAAIAAALALTGGFVELATLAALAVVGVYLVGCVAAVVLQRRGTARAGAPLDMPALWAPAAVGVAGMLWLAANAKPAELAGLGATVGAAAAVYAVRRRMGAAPAAVST